MKNLIGYRAIIIYLVIIKLLIHLLNIEYGYFRDELYYLAISENFSFKNLEILPLTPIYLKIMSFLFGTSLKAIHFASALLGAGAIIFSCLITKELGGKRLAVFFTGLTVIFSGYLAFGSLMTYDGIDFLLWAIAIYTLVQILKYDKPKLWLLFGLIIGIGLLNKLTIVFLGVSVFLGLWLVPQRIHFKTIWIWFGGIIALAGSIPFILWQIKYNWYYIDFAQNYAGGNSYIASLPEFLWNQILPNNITNLPVWLTGLIMLFSKSYKPYRMFGYVYIILFAACYTLGVKFYFMIPIYIILLSVGSIVIINFISVKLKKRSLQISFILLYFILSSILVPIIIPILPPDKLEPYTSVLGTDASIKYEYSKLNQLPQHFADRFGWEEMVQLVRDSYMNSSIKKDDLGIITANWGQAAALYFYSDKYSLPKPICLDGWFYFEANRNHEIKDNYITIGFTNSELENLFNEIDSISVYTNDYCMPYENNKLIHSCSKAKIDLKSYARISRFIDKNFLNLIKNESVETAILYYIELKKSNLDTLLFTERQLNSIGYEFLNSEKISEAKALFQLNIDAFPNSANTYDSMAEAYMKNNEFMLATKFYKKSLDLNPQNDNAKKMLGEIKKKSFEKNIIKNRWD